MLEDPIYAMEDEKELTFFPKYYPCKWLKTSDLPKYEPWYASKINAVRLTNQPLSVWI